MKVLSAHKYLTNPSWGENGWRFETRDDCHCDKEILFISRARIIDSKKGLMYIFSQDGHRITRSINVK